MFAYVKPLYTALLLLCLHIAHAQGTSYTITGTVSDSTTNNAVELANVILKPKGGDSIVTATSVGADGKFELQKIKEGNYDLHLSFIGYAPKMLQLNVKGDIQLGNVPLSSSAKSIGEAVIVTQKNLIVKNSEKTVYNVAQDPTNQIGNAEDVLRNMPGVSVDQKGNISIIGKQGIRVLVDGRPNAMAENDLQAYLKSVPANSIESIEIITNPSARYDAEGNAGIINIKLKKGRANGLNGTLSAGYGILNRYNGNAAINYRKNKFNLFASYAINYHKIANRYIETREISVNDTLTFYNMDSKGKESGLNNNAKLGFDYFVGDKGTFTYTASGNYSTSRWRSEAEAQNLNSQKELTADYFSINDERGKSFTVTNDIMYTHKLDTNGQEITVDVTHSYVNANPRADMNSSAHDSLGNYSEAMSLHRQTGTTTGIHNMIAQLDYTYVFSKGKAKGHKIDAGLKNETTLNDNLYNAYTVLSNVAYKDTLLSNSFNYTENIAAAYLIYGGSFKEWFSWSAGLRAEHTYIKSNNNSVNRQYISFFPSASLGFVINDKNNFSISYSRRVQRPQFRQLNNTVSFIDQYSTWQGNPLLQPSFSDVISISHSLTLKKHMFVFEAVGQLQTKDFIESSRVDSNRISRGGNSNGADRKMLALNFYFKLELTKWWDLQMNHGYNYSYYSYAAGVNTKPISGHQYNLWASTSFKFWKNTVLDINGWFNTGGVQSQGKSLPVGVINASIKKSFLKDNQLSVSIAARNIAQSMKWRWTVDNTNLKTVGSWQGLDRVVMLTISYRFGGKAPQRKEKEGNDRLGGGGGRG